MNKKLIGGLGLLAVIIVWIGLSIYPDWLWFGTLGFSSVFWTLVLSKFGVGLAVWLAFVAIVFFNLYLARRLNPMRVAGELASQEPADQPQLPISGKALGWLFIGFILLISLAVAFNGSSRWDLALRYFYQQPFGTTDPVFNIDIGYYVFSLPFYRFIQSWLLGFLIFTGLLTIFWYLKDGVLQVMHQAGMRNGQPPSLPKMTLALKAKKHLVLLAGIVALLLAWGYYLKIYEILYSTQGPAFGASYTDVNIKIISYWVLIIASLGVASILFINVSKPKTRLIWLGAGIWLGAVVAFSVILPGIVQQFLVKPNELAKESKYIAHNIDYTRQAYNLNKIKEVDFMVGDDLGAEDIERNNVTIQNIRIWDERPLLQTYRQIQSMRLYYDFGNVDVDRYLINNQYRQVMLAAREVVVNQLPLQANTWVNRHLIYTHGYGVALSPVNEVTGEGLPRLLIKDLPPVFDTDLTIDRPEIYYGEKTDKYVLVRTSTKEFDYPKGDQNVYTTYQGTGGVPIDSLRRRILYAFEFRDTQILFTSYLTPESRIMYNRRIEKRVDSIAPFLDYDGDPYLVIVQGKLYWIQDAYTTSPMYPYSKRSWVKYPRFKNKTLNYIRNSVKVVIDAYNGDVSFYVIDKTDPVVKTYSSIFPDLFKSFDEMPDDLKKHIRYPKDLFEIQVDTYKTYHMKDVQVFYNQEDLWETPGELYGDNRQEMEPYYIIIKLPGEDREEFLLMLPFTPSKKDNMIGWVAARSDLPHYGNLLSYKLPKEKLVYGPMQIEARVDQQTDISKELTLWGQRGSRVIRGNLLAIPMSDSFIFVEPVYLEAKQEERELTPPGQSPVGGTQRRRTSAPLKQDSPMGAALPELKRVIVAFGDRLIMRDNLDQALDGIFGAKVFSQALASPDVSDIPHIDALVASALEHYEKAQEYLQQRNWGGYGRALDDLEKVLKQMAGTVGEGQ
jgi:uncharacterized membrane protein (UPF0182 family)